MRLNNPVSHREYALEAGTAIISKTDAKGRMTFVNQDFLDSCGYEEDELLGQPHNLLRHPDMPAEAFRDLWETIKSGMSWSGLVKNRRKDGDHYWVRASVTPLADGGYMSVRQTPARDEVAAAETLYKDMREGRGPARLYRGQVYMSGIRLRVARLLGNIRISRKLWLMNALALLFILVLGGNTLYQMRQDMAGLKSVYEDRTVPLRDLAQIQKLLNENVAEVLRGYQSAPGAFAGLPAGDATVHLERIEHNRLEIDRLWKAYMVTTLTPEEEALATVFSEKRAEYVRGYLRPAVEEMRDGRFDSAPFTAFLREDQGVGGEVRHALDQLMALQANEAKAEYLRAGERFQMVRDASSGLMLLATLLLIVAAWTLSNTIVRPVRAACDAARAIAQGDLKTRLPGGRGDEVGELLTQLTRMRDNLFEMVYSIRGKAEILSEASTELSGAAGTAARSAEEQSESASSMAAAVEQMSVSIDQVGEHAHAAHALSKASGEASEQGGAVIHRAAAEMRGIAETVGNSANAIRDLESHSNEISAIVGVIKEIADQTNLLALNAAIEAARAGEQGRGFAVVADEVRKLAERTGNSTVQITQMIERIQSGAQKAVAEMEASMARVGEGVNTTHEAGNSVIGIQENANRVVQSVDDIALALKEQGVASQDIAKNVERIAQMCEQNSAVARKTSSSAQRLSETARQLRMDAARFQV
ncbi:MAG: methyl-accepting chemotaxis protein [Gallionellaceae bacterium]|nr:methyl-accepting chemotaxis protein [Gallionellaceae bacterium]